MSKPSTEASADLESVPQTYATLDEWIAREAIPFSLDSPSVFNAAVDQVIASLGDSVELLGFGEALHGGEEILILRNRLFQRLVEAHGYSAIALESSFPRALVLNEYVAGRGPSSYEAVQETGFSHGFFGRLEANRELVEWMRRYNGDPAHHVKLQFYGFDSPTEMTGTDSPRQLLEVVLDYLASLDSAGGQAQRERLEPLLGQDAKWENPAAMMDPTQAVGLTPAATALRIETEELISELHRRRPELAAKSDPDRYLEALQAAVVARQLLNYHAELARASSDRTARLLGIRDAMMADNLAYMVARECGRGKVLAFAHNNHLQRGQTQWQTHWQQGPDLLIWWPAGAHLHALFGARYAVIGSAVGVSEANGIGRPKAGTLEARLTAAPGPARFIPTHQGQGLPASEIAALPARTGGAKNFSYFPLTAQSLTDFDWLAVLDAVTYHRGGPPLPEWDAQ
jgi:erythromycin esterase-like protein